MKRQGFITFARLGMAALLSAAAQLASAAPQPEKYWMPRDASEHGHLIDRLLIVTTVFVVLLFIIMCIWMVWAALKHNEKHQAQYDHGTSKHSVYVALGLSAVIFAVVDGNLFVSTIVDLRNAFWNFDIPEKDPRAVKIEVNAHQWAWDARYPGPDGKWNTEDDIVTLNDIRVPVGVPVAINLASTDVIHNFYLPNFRVKVDAVPGNVNHLWFQAKQKGEFEIGCAQHCGTHHYKMRGILTVMAPEDYQAWYAAASQDGKRTFDPNDKDAQWGWEWRKWNQ